MIPPSLEIRCPLSIEELLALLAKYRESSRVLAGGQGLVPALRRRSVRPSMLLDMRRIPGLDAVEPDGEGIRVGPLATYGVLETSSVVRARCPFVADVAGEVGDAELRNRATLAGSVCEADPAADAPAVLTALDAQLEILGPRGAKSARVADFIQGAGETALEPDEIVRSLYLPGAGAGSGAYVRQPLCASGFAVAGVAALVRLEDGFAREVRVAVTGAARRVFRASDLEQDLAGRQIERELVEAVARDVCRGRELLDDVDAPASYRSRLVDVLAARAVFRAARGRPAGGRERETA